MNGGMVGQIIERWMDGQIFFYGYMDGDGGWKERQMDGWNETKNRWMDRKETWMDEQIERSVDGLIDRWKKERVSGLMNEQLNHK